VGLTLVTGGPGFIGSHVTRALLERGDRVRVTVRARSLLENLEGLAAEHVACDLLDRRQVRRALAGVEKLFHCAGLTSLRAGGDAHFEINVQGTRILLEEALAAGVRRVVHTSSFAAVGPAVGAGRTADERQHFRAGRFGLPYVNAMREGEGEALRLAARGLPVVIVNPTYVFGRGDVHRSSTEIVRRFLRREIPAYVEGTVNIVAAQDVAAGHLLADELGEVGERYLLGNRNFTLDRLFADLGRISGVEPPAVKLPLPAAIALARALSPLPGIPGVHEIELKSMAQHWAYRSTKAKRLLGWSPGAHEECLEQTVAWYRDREPQVLRRAGTRQPLALRATGAGLRRAEAMLARLV
jgi:dihydroflavonol-4-reductase